MVKAPPLVEPDWQGSEQLSYPDCEVGVSGRWILHLIKLSWKPAEIVNRPRRGADCDGGLLDVPVRRHAEDCFRFRQLCAD